ncbi:hypothetical protein CVS40_8620 [Lucilia cuprina]|nr:hypothetical protein CVS40_8620 [Lucilia cuprina]
MGRWVLTRELEEGFFPLLLIELKHNPKASNNDN